MSQRPPDGTPLPSTQASSQRVLSSSVLFAGKNEVRIAHAGVEYLLRITKENKLILTK
jgi:hemin uptake protein HemP